MDHTRSINLEGLGLSRLDVSELVAPWSEEEVWEVIKTMPVDKAPSPDVFTMNFYHKCWGIIKKEFVDDFNRLYLLGGRILKLSIKP